jgi:hypothetical protein
MKIYLKLGILFPLKRFEALDCSMEIAVVDFDS